MDKKTEAVLQSLALKKNETLYKAATRESDGTAYVCSAIGTPYTAPDLEQTRKEAYEKGLSDAWKAARRIGSDSRYGLEIMGFKFEPRAVGDDPGWHVVQRYSASECIEKIRQYEQEKEEQKQLQVGDEVKLKRCDIYAVYMGGLNGSNERNVYLCFNDGSCGVQSKSEIERKTGRHFPEIAEVLRKMREGQDG